MRKILPTAIALGLLTGAAMPAMAQTHAPNSSPPRQGIQNSRTTQNDDAAWPACAGDDEDYSRALQISSCTALIEGGRQSSTNLAMAYNNRGVVYYRERDYRRAVADYDQAIEADPQLELAYRNRGDAYDELGDYDRAIADYDAALRMDPRDAQAYALRGFTYGMRLNDNSRAIADYDQALRINPDDAVTFNNRGRAYYNLKDFDRAVEDFGEAIRLSPRYGAALRNRGDAYDELGDYDRAIADYDYAIEINPRDAAAFTLRGYTYRRLPDYPRAIADYREATELDPTSYRWDGLCWTIVMANGDMNEARRACDAGLEMDPDHVSLHDSRGMVNLRQRRFQEAFNDYNAAARADPQNAARYIYGRGLAAIGMGRTAEGQADLARARQRDPRANAVFKAFGVDQAN